jgi:DNA helicase HerA-like ATPase
MVMGRRGCGKSFLAKRLQALWPKRVIIDSLNEYTEGIKVSNFNSFCEKMAELKKNKTKKFVLIFQFNPEDDLNHETFNQIMRLCYYFGKIQIVIEEVQLYASPHRIPHWLKQCLLTGRHQGLSLLFTTQRPGELNKTILSQCAHIFCGQIVEGNDLRYISSFLNQDAQRLSSLPERRFIYFSDDGIKEISNKF